jgi:hypothetical protein
LVFKNSINKLIKENQPITSKGRKKSKILENIIKKLKKNIGQSKGLSPNKNNRNPSKMKILSKDKHVKNKESITSKFQIFN